MTGTGAFLFGARWNSPGRYAVYTSGNISLAMLEVLVHIDDAETFLAKEHIYHNVVFDEKDVVVLDEASLPDSWNARPETIESQAIGDEWLEGLPSVVLAVPSVVVPTDLRYEQEYLNYLINPHHPDFERAIRVGETRVLDWDPRLKTPQ